jgi:hypothetical protein
MWRRGSWAQRRNAAYLQKYVHSVIVMVALFAVVAAS